MFGGFALRFVPCDECGASVAKSELATHACDEGRRLEYQLFQHREELAAVEDEIRAYLDSPRGRFDAWYAERRRRLA